MELQLSLASEKPTRLDQFPAVIGRADDADLQLPNILASRRHCEVVLEGSEFVLRDLGSVNGTLLNGQPVTEQVLRSGDVIMIGASQITVISTKCEDESKGQSSFRSFSHRLMSLVRS